MLSNPDKEEKESENDLRVEERENDECYNSNIDAVIYNNQNNKYLDSGPSKDYTNSNLSDEISKDCDEDTNFVKANSPHKILPNEALHCNESELANETNFMKENLHHETSSDETLYFSKSKVNEESCFTEESTHFKPNLEKILHSNEIESSNNRLEYKNFDSFFNNIESSLRDEHMEQKDLKNNLKIDKCNTFPKELNSVTQHEELLNGLSDNDLESCSSISPVSSQQNDVSEQNKICNKNFDDIEDNAIDNDDLQNLNSKNEIDQLDNVEEGNDIMLNMNSENENNNVNQCDKIEKNTTDDHDVMQNLNSESRRDSIDQLDNVEEDNTTKNNDVISNMNSVNENNAGLDFTPPVEQNLSVKPSCYHSNSEENVAINIRSEKPISNTSDQMVLSSVSDKVISSESFRNQLTQTDSNVTNTTSSCSVNPLDTVPRMSRKLFLCSACSTFYKNYDLYIHMREIHDSHICLFCFGIFTHSQDLCDHLINVHKLKSTKFKSTLQLQNTFKNSFFISCCTCNSLFTNEDPFENHTCMKILDSSNSNSVEKLNSDKLHPIYNENEREKTPIASTSGYISVDNRPNISSVVQSTSIKNNSDSIVDETSKGDDTMLNNIKNIENSTDIEKSLRKEFFIASPPKLLDCLKNNQVLPEDCKILETEPNHVNETNRFDDHAENVDTTNYSSSPVANNSSFDMDIDNINNIETNKNNCDAMETNETYEPASLVSAADLENSFSGTNIENNEVFTTNNNPLCTNTYEMCNENLHVDSNKIEFLENESKNNSEFATENESIETNTTINEIPKSDVLNSANVIVSQTLAMALTLDESVRSIEIKTLIKECVKTSCLTCMYCYNATIIAVNCVQLIKHLLSEHRFVPTKNDDSSEDVITKLQSALLDLVNIYLNTSSSQSFVAFDGIYVCFQCTFTTQLLKDLCQHKKKTHQKNIFLCIMCKCNFVYYSGLLCHLCPGLYSSEQQNTLNFRCCFCTVDNIPSNFRLMVHLRKIHQACDICLLRYKDQYELFSHMTKQHKMHHMCYKCNLAYRSRDDISKHLFWKHGTESVLCKKCLQKKWSHAYHFCIPSSTFTCEECNSVFSKAVALTVHRRIHTNEFPFNCTECDQHFISKKLLLAHEKLKHIRPNENRIQNETYATPVSYNDRIILSCTSKENEVDNFRENANEENNKDDKNDKKKRKKKRKKIKSNNEKPLLDELPPLNLSSESEEDSVEEENADSKLKVNTPQIPPLPLSDEPSTSNVASSPVENHLTSLDPVFSQVDKNKDENIDSSILTSLHNESNINSNTTDKCENLINDKDASCSQTKQENSLEKILNCLTVEHSYCIPDSIFRSEFNGENAVSKALESSVDSSTTKLSISPSQNHSKNHDKSCSKSITPKKRKRAQKKPRATDSSTTDSSSDSDSSSSSCGSNCSCNRSNSNCSSSSSGSESTESPDKKKVHIDEHAKDSQESESNVQVKEETLSLNVAESDLDTELSSLDENFYDEHPSYNILTQTENQMTASSALIPSYLPQMNPNISIVSPVKKQTRSRKSRKRRKSNNTKIKINIGAKPTFTNSILENNNQINSSLNRTSNVNSPLIHTFKTLLMNNKKTFIHINKKNSPITPEMNLSTETYTPTNDLSISSISNSADNNANRLSKRKRVKNKFYGYSSGEERNSELNRSTPSAKKRIIRKKQPKNIDRPFIGIRTKPFPVLPSKRLPTSPVVVPKSTVPNLSPVVPNVSSVYKSNYEQFHSQSAISSPQNVMKNLYASSSSDDSDSDEKKERLVINLPVPKERKFNNYSSHRTPSYQNNFTIQKKSLSSQKTLNFSKPSIPVVTPSPEKVSNKLYCYCRCPYDEVSEMIACDGPNCRIEWFHFDCVQIKVPPKGKWFCPDCRKNPENVTNYFFNQNEL